MYSILHRALVILLLSAVATSTSAQDDPFRTNIRPTKWLSPEQEQGTFKLPPGFEIELFAAEPQIQKPLNMAFDDRGRLWLTDSVEYPHPVEQGKAGRDSIKILEDTNGDGTADQITTFAEGLNIPIGLLPYGEGAIVWSIPHIWYLRDTDHDGRADKREKLYGPFGWQRDTHGMNNGFTRAYDGWIYACHGYNNHTTVQGADGHQITMQSGNTYRFRPDGSRIEQYTHGQVNPFGMTVTEMGDLITADCHSKPLYLLLYQGYYPSFGRPHDGLGYVPPIMTHTHGSTALCGPCYYSANQFPAEYRGNVFVGNVMTSRVNRNQLQWHGSTPRAIEKPDLVSTTDPWFRPVDVQQGPDGAVYVADFYNRIIGHYEVPLDHPGRDLTSGRIWRVVYRGDAPESESPRPAIDLPSATTKELIASLASENLTQRLVALNYCAEHATDDLTQAIATRIESGEVTSAATLSSMVSVLERTDSLTESRFNAALRASLKPELVARLVQILAERPQWEPAMHEWLLDLLADEHYRGVVHRKVAVALAMHVDQENIAPLLDALKQCPSEDTLLEHQLRIALRNHLRLEGALEQLKLEQLDRSLATLTAQAALGTDSAAAGNFLVAFLTKYEVANVTQAANYARHAARFAGDVNFDQLAQKLPARLEHQPLRQLKILRGIGEGLQQCGCRPSGSLNRWATDLVGQVLRSEPAAISWTTEPIEDKPHRADMFVVQPRKSSDGDTMAPFVISLPRGETLCGIYRSGPFELPSELSFYLAGHNGFPEAKQRTGNKIQLVDATTGEVLREAPPPRKDIAQPIVWKFPDGQDRQVRVEVIDADAGKAFAWLAVGRFSLERLNPSNHEAQLRLASELTLSWALAGFEPLLEDQLQREGHAGNTVAALANALLASHASDVRLTALGSLLDQPLAEPLQSQIVRAVVTRDDELTSDTLTQVMRASPAATQQKLAEQLAGSPLGAGALIDLVQQGKASARLLTRPQVKQKLATLEDQELQQSIAKLTALLPPANQEIAQRIQRVRKQYRAAEVSVVRGQMVFKKNCAVCHKIGEQGEMIGPQLDGIGNRGLDRVLEDLLDPHRNVDIQFRTTTLVMSDGKILTGLARKAESGQIELIDSQGKKTLLAADAIEEQKQSPLSLMPDNMAEKLSAQERNDLLSFLLGQTAKQ